MKPSPNRTVWCNRGWYPMFFGFCPSKAAWDHDMRRMVKKKHREPYPEEDGTCNHFTNRDGNICCIVVLAERYDKVYATDPAGVVALLAHEAMHVYQQLLQTIGEKSPSIEFEAYAMQNIVGQLYGAYLDTRIKQRAKAKRK